MLVAGDSLLRFTRVVSERFDVESSAIERCTPDPGDSMITVSSSEWSPDVRQMNAHAFNACFGTLINPLHVPGGLIFLDLVLLNQTRMEWVTRPVARDSDEMVFLVGYGFSEKLYSKVCLFLSLI